VRRLSRSKGEALSLIVLGLSFIPVVPVLQSCTGAEVAERVTILKPTGEHAVTPIRRVGDWYKFHVRNQDAVGGKRGRRSEFFYKPRWRQGQQGVFGFSFYFPPGFKPSSSWDYIAQFHKDGDQGGWGGPPVGISINDRGNLAVVVRGSEKGEEPYEFEIAKLVPAQRYDVVLEIRFSSMKDGYVEAWVNGREVMPRRMGSTLYADGSGAYIRTGYYLGKPDGSGILHSALPRVGESVDGVLRSFQAQTLTPGSSERGFPSSPSRGPFSSAQNLRDGQTVTGLVRWEATVSGGTVSRVEFLIDGKLRWTEELAPYCFEGDACTWDTTEESDGDHMLEVRAVASDGRVSSSRSRVEVANP
jgi:hypothetical protein